VGIRRSPTVRRRRLGMELRRLRETAGLTIERVAEELECSHSKISRIETAQVGATPRDVRDMLGLYGVEGEERDHLVQIAREARQKGWWHAYVDVPQTAYVDMEAEAASIRIYEGLVLPGLVQTRTYARAVLQAVRVDLRPDELERRVEFRMARQRLLSQGDPPMLWMIVDESVVRRPVGGLSAMREQLHHLVKLTELPAVTFQVLPYEAGAHAGMDGPFTIFTFPDSADLEVIYFENTQNDFYLESVEAIRRYKFLFDHLRAAALKPDDSIALLISLAEELPLKSEGE